MWEGMYFVSPASLIFLGILIATLEWQQMVDENAWGQIVEHPLIFLAAGTLGFGVNYCSLGKGLSQSPRSASLITAPT